MSTRNDSRLKIKRRIASKVRGVADRPRLLVYKSNQRIYAQLVNDEAGRTITSVCSVSFEAKDKSKDKKSSVNIDKAAKIGELIGEKAKALGINQVVFDRSGYPYHGKVKALADGARSKGIKF